MCVVAAPAARFGLAAADGCSRVSAPRRGLDSPGGRKDPRDGRSSAYQNGAAKGLIEGAPFVHGRGIGYVIRPRAVMDFQSRFVTVAAVARASGGSPRAVLRQLSGQGVATVGDFADGPARRGHLVSISDLAGLPIPRAAVNQPRK